jgi:hypothetical protein
MLFRVCEHYDEQYYQDTIQCYNECFICFQYKIDSENNPSTLKTHNLYINNCACNGSVHIKCLKIWVDMNKSCPICRIHVIENNNATIIIYNYISLGISIYNFTKNISLKALRVLSVILFIYSLLDLYFISIKTRYAYQNDYIYVPIPILENKYGEIFNHSHENNN